MGATLSGSQGLPSPQANSYVLDWFLIHQGDVMIPPKDWLAQELMDTWYVVPTGKDNFVVSAGRPNIVPAGRTIVSPGSIIFGPGG
ncbi:hypothetical protein Tco_0478678 [Tanacetum coccineum]